MRLEVTGLPVLRPEALSAWFSVAYRDAEIILGEASSLLCVYCLYAALSIALAPSRFLWLSRNCCTEMVCSTRIPEKVK